MITHWHYMQRQTVLSCVRLLRELKPYCVRTLSLVLTHVIAVLLTTYCKRLTIVYKRSEISV